jgi:hypothetical protein
MSKAFEVVESYLAPGFVVVRGRAWEDVSVGQLLRAEKGSGTFDEYRVAFIYTYGRAIDCLNTVLTGDLGLVGKHEPVASGVFLYSVFIPDLK